MSIVNGVMCIGSCSVCVSQMYDKCAVACVFSNKRSSAQLNLQWNKSNSG